MKIAKKATTFFLTFFIAAGMCFTAWAAGPGDTVNAPIPVTWSNLRLDASGMIGFEMQIPDGRKDLVPQYYEVNIEIKTTGNFVPNRTKKYKNSSLNVREDITFTKVGIYRFSVTCHFIGGDVSTGSAMEESPQCVVTEEYIINPDDDGPGYGPGGQGSNVGPGGGPGSGSGVTPTAMGKSAWYQDPVTKKWYYAATTGTWLKNTWYFINNNWYYFDNDCSMHTGWLSLGGYWYYLHPVEAPEGHRASGFAKIDGKWYYFDPGSGVMQTGVIAVGGYIYCMDASGAMLMNEGTPDGHYYDGEGHRIR